MYIGNYINSNIAMEILKGIRNSLGFRERVKDEEGKVSDSIVRTKTIGDWLGRQWDIAARNLETRKTDGDTRGIMTYDRGGEGYDYESRKNALNESKKRLEELKREPFVNNPIPTDNEIAAEQARQQNWEASQKWRAMDVNKAFMEAPPDNIEGLASTNPKAYAEAMIKHYEEQFKATDMSWNEKALATVARYPDQAALWGLGGLMANSVVGNPVGNTISWLIPGENPSDNFDIGLPMDEQQRQAELARLKRNLQRDSITAQALSGSEGQY